MSESTFGDALRALRKQLHLSQEVMAGTLGTTQRHISFLENGRSAPTRAMLGRIVTGLGLSAAHRASLFEASGFRNPYPHRSLEREELLDALELMNRQVLRHWPFPGFVVDRDWNFLRCNAPGTQMLAMFGGPPNMHTMFLSDAFAQVVENWEQASSGFYFRIQEVARRSELVRNAFESAVAAGRFEHVAKLTAGVDDIPVYLPIVIGLPGMPRMQITSMHGRLISVFDAVAEGLEIELMIPLDEETEGPLLELFSGP